MFLGIISAEELEEPNLNETYEPEDEEIIQDAFIEEDSVDLEKALGNVPYTVKRIAPAQRINIEIGGLEESGRFSLFFDASYTEMSINQSHVENPTLGVKIDDGDIVNGETEFEDLVNAVEDGDIEIEGYNWFNRAMIFFAERILL